MSNQILLTNKHNKRDQKTHNGMQITRYNFHPQLWGPDAWNFIHIVALAYPWNPSMSDKKRYRHFFFHLGQVLPCENCAQNYERHWKKYPIEKYMNNPDELFEWTVIIRNAVKQQITNTDKIYYDARKLKQYYTGENNRMKKNSLPLTLSIFAIIGTGALSLMLFL